MSDSEIALLGLLAEKPRYGYELDKIIERRGMREWTDIAFSSIYAVLRTLEKKGLVSAATEVAGNRVRKLYSVTKEGRRALKDALKTLIAEPVPPNDTMMLALAYAGVLSGEDTQQAYAARLKLLEEAKVRLSARMNENKKSPLNVKLMFERSLASVDSEIRFAQSMVAEVAGEFALGEAGSSPEKPTPRNDVKRPEPENTPDDEVKETLF